MNRALILTTTSIGSFVTPFFSSVVSFAVPKIALFYHLNFQDASLIPLIILIPLASTMILLGRLADSIGRTFIFRIGFLIFSVSAFIGAFSKSFPILTVALFFSGFGSAALSTNSTALIGYIFAGDKRGSALGINAMAVYLGLTMAPFLGGILIEFVGWQSIFYLTAPLALIGLAVSFATLKGVEAKGRMNSDYLSAVFFSTALFSLAFFLALGYVYNFEQFLPLLIIGVAFLYLFFHRNKRVETQLIPANLFKSNRTFLFSNVTALLNYLSTFSIVFVFSIYLQVILKVSPFQAGLSILPEPVFMVILSPIAGRISDRIGSRYLASAGMAIIGLSFLFLYVFPKISVFLVMVFLSFIGIGFGFFSAPNTNSVMGSAPREMSGIASGFLGTMRFVGQFLSILVASFILSTFMPRTMVVGIFSGIFVTISQAYYDSFVSGFRLVMLISAVLSFIGAYTSLMKETGR
ncbi:multidrug resistance protein [Thermoplasma volcanium GSS1]|uniref:Multidrug resistance protein n=1 Tax=Thermoplasma volcanium (strain ATCC 51530 / DSM 4299 / JCM 9571 / NBRC 15438 / GSS1) TaxID=273116 RepID=Q97AJ5_THEVO|nr:MFS transporter [Thermoplasma volcanium]BAB59957.1 multidrug resistance protein [Thermoplasma volcanium GSS1]